MILAFPRRHLLDTVLALFVMMPLILGTKILNPVNIVAALRIYSIALCWSAAR